MSLIKCPECGKDMSDKAPSCPSCGCPIDVVIAERQRIKKEAEIKKQQEETEKAVGKKYKRQVLSFFGLLAAIVIVIAGYSIINAPPRYDATDILKEAEEKRHKAEFEKEYQANDAYYTATQFIKKRLKSPSTAEFPNPKYARIQLLEDGATYKIYGYVDSQNSYGAMLRVNWYAKLIRSGQEWRLLDMKIYER
jgi:hypothetical protein